MQRGFLRAPGAVAVGQAEAMGEMRTPIRPSAPVSMVRISAGCQDVLASQIAPWPSKSGHNTETRGPGQPTQRAL